MFSANVAGRWVGRWASDTSHTEGRLVMAGTGRTGSMMMRGGRVQGFNRGHRGSPVFTGSLCTFSLFPSSFFYFPSSYIVSYGGPGICAGLHLGVTEG